MKTIRKILYALLGILSVLSLFIVICAFNPQLADKVSEILYSSPKKVTETDTVPVSGSNESHPDTKEQEALKINENTSGYSIPEKSSIMVPEELIGRNGYVPVQDNNEQIDDSEAEKLKEKYTYGETGDSLSFDTEFYPYYGMLDHKLQKLYRQIYANTDAVNGIFNPVEEVQVSQLKDVFMAVINDHPELFWLDSAYRGKFDSRGICVEIVLLFNDLADNLEVSKSNYNMAADEILAGAGALGSDYDKEVYVHDALIERIEYDLQAHNNQSAYSALVDGRTVCAGYARAFQYLMTQLGVPCYYCTGYSGQNHAWNIIKLDGEYYNADTTWDDTDPRTYNYFNKPDTAFSPTHRREDLSVYLPPCSGSRYSNLESNPEAEEMQEKYNNLGRTLEEVGFTEDSVIGSIEDYYSDCASQIISSGGTCLFQNVVENVDLGLSCLDIYDDHYFAEAYMYEVLSSLNAKGCEIYVTAEELNDGRVLMEHEVSVY